jgi:hypothetical protein
VEKKASSRGSSTESLTSHQQSAAAGKGFNNLPIIQVMQAAKLKRNRKKLGQICSD